MMGAALVALAASAVALERARAAELDWPAIEKNALELLRDLIRIDTRSKDETKVLDRVRADLEKRGLHPTIDEDVPGRGNLVVRLAGTGKGAPLLLVAHVDTVNFDKAEGWSADPLAAEIKDGELVGRGALDDKGQVALALTSLALLEQEGLTLARDVVVMLNADEESTGAHGAGFMVKDRWSKIAPVGAALNEGGRCSVVDGKVALVGIQTAEKIYNDVVIRVKGTSGHSSVPLPGNAIAKLARAIAKLDSWKPRLHVTADALGTLRGLAAIEKDATKKAQLLALESRDEAERARAASVLAEADPRLNALLRSTFVPTLLRGGVRENQLPPSAEVNLNVRLLPDERIDGFTAELRHALGDEGDLELEVVTASAPSPASPADHPLFRAIEAAAKRAFPDAVVVPSLSTGATDSRFLRSKGVPCFGLGPFPLEEKHSRSVHGPDERVPVASFGRGLRFYCDVVRSYATTAD
jgi:acetylornithine deacetylase/succinyl-diaminopimelate desuccinylase-like protein